MDKDDQDQREHTETVFHNRGILRMSTLRHDWSTEPAVPATEDQRNEERLKYVL
jgi:hypothetical protein